ncbi:N-methyl-L-tryptophan oxidase, partial [Mycobacterium tuberculosis]|nr:N-methyl-L-tryptophan oxidase [Mycobacterium tuberculosis]
TLLTVTGSLEIGRTTGSDIVDGALKAAREHKLMHTLLGRDELMRRFPVFDIPASYCGVWQPDGGFLRPEPALRAFHR